MIKTIIFDFDNTLYRGDSTAIWQGWVEYCLEGFERFLPHMNKKQVVSLFEKYFPEAPFLFTGQNVASVLNSEKGSAAEWITYLEEIVFLIRFAKATPVSNDMLKKLTMNHSLYIVSNSPVSIVHEYAKGLSIELKHFKGIFNNPFLPADVSKYHLYRNILELEKITSNQLLVIGDNWEADIEPAYKLGAKGLHFPGAKMFTYNDIVNSKEYKN